MMDFASRLDWTLARKSLCKGAMSLKASITPTINNLIEQSHGSDQIFESLKLSDCPGSAVGQRPTFVGSQVSKDVEEDKLRNHCGEGFLTRT